MTPFLKRPVSERFGTETDAGRYNSCSEAKGFRHLNLRPPRLRWKYSRRVYWRFGLAELGEALVRSND